MVALLCVWLVGCPLSLSVLLRRSARKGLTAQQESAFSFIFDTYRESCESFASLLSRCTTPRSAR